MCVYSRLKNSQENPLDLTARKNLHFMLWIKRLNYYICWFACLCVSSSLIKLYSPLISCVKEFHSLACAVCISTAWFAVLGLKEPNSLLFTQWILLILHMPRIKVNVKHPLAHEPCWASQCNALRPACFPALAEQGQQGVSAVLQILLSLHEDATCSWIKASIWHS